ncbi:hypothetical protein KGA66_21255 [Actinocrinis puniceicyclus]|uniref:Uncharacterized protein n=1 Tax=Actinocrinis puniceicyclus TaxID=977794 RepID=A0A8J7WSE1_9ACTN|nr:hypothetical protein [Actinocrinis puniceicyclus]MBS2965592.1 hypothetical protein [Actinocrinis puniceicyclus]
MMGTIGDQGIPKERTPLIDPAFSDHIVAQCAALRRLDCAAPWLAPGPSATGTEQEWVATGRPSWLPPRVATPRRDTFQEVVTAAGDTAPLGPVRGGMFTCTTTAAQPGMWHAYLRAQGENVLWPRPWHLWRMKPAPDATIYHVSSAQAWTALVREYHHRICDLLHPDWSKIANIADAVHVAPAAVCAIDGLRLSTGLGPIAPTYWTVESTLWLRWRFDHNFGAVYAGTAE